MRPAAEEDEKWRLAACTRRKEVGLELSVSTTSLHSKSVLFPCRYVSARSHLSVHSEGVVGRVGCSAASYLEFQAGAEGFGLKRCSVRFSWQVDECRNA